MKLWAVKRIIILRKGNCAQKSRQKRGGERIFLERDNHFCCFPMNKHHTKIGSGAQNGQSVSLESAG
jgi:hypothetical protein